jgi:hypothetical protein
MYFIQPTRSISYLDQALNELPSLQIIHIDDLDLYDQTIIAIADVQDFLKYQWKLPTIVLAFEHEGTALAQAWEMGALAGWIWSELPKNPVHSLFKIDAQYKRNQDSRDLPSAAELQKDYYQTRSNYQTINLNHFFSLQLTCQEIGMITGD